MSRKVLDATSPSGAAYAQPMYQLDGQEPGSVRSGNAFADVTGSDEYSRPPLLTVERVVDRGQAQ